MTPAPFLNLLSTDDFIPERCDGHVTRRLSSMRGQFLDTEAYDALLEKEDTLLYEVFEFRVPEAEGELLSGVSVVHCFVVGEEYNMTKGHFHHVIETAEVYYCLQGQGMMVMENPEGDATTKELRPGTLLYVPPRWAHRSVNTSDRDDLVTLFVYPANAGHDYGTIEKSGFRKIVVRGVDGPRVVDNPRWQHEGRS